MSQPFRVDGAKSAAVRHGRHVSNGRTEDGMSYLNRRPMPIGGELIGNDQAHFRVWAPKAQRVEVALETSVELNANRQFYPLEPEPDGYFAGVAPARAGTLYRFRLNGEHLYPDPASRYQPGGPHRSSCLVDPTTYPWRDNAWNGVSLEGQIVYELHVGTFTSEGTWTAAARQLPQLAADGITLIEMMPIAEFPGEFGWGYDGVNLFAPYHIYGAPDDLRGFVDAAHSLGMGVLLDVVFNHFGPDGNYLRAFSDDYLTDRHENDWGDAINFDGPNSGPVREFFLCNARYWIEEFHFDGFRFDATQTIFDQSQEHILAAIEKVARAAAGARKIILTAENETQDVTLVRPEKLGGCSFDGLWNDDFHHSAWVALTGRHPAYYSDYRGKAQEFVSAAKYGFLYQGQYYRWQRKCRGTPALNVAPAAFVSFIENHDQVANSGDGARLRVMTSPGRYRAITTLLLLAPWTPLLFQGQEFGATTPFLYFADHREELRGPVRKGRFNFLKQFPGLVSSEWQAELPDPSAGKTFQRCKLDPAERERFPQVRALYRDLIRLRREDARFARQERGTIDGAVLERQAFVLRFFDSLGEERLLMVNLGAAFAPEVLAEPLLAPPAACCWQTLWSSEAPRYGGPGEVPLEMADRWQIPAEAAVVLRSVPLA